MPKARRYRLSPFVGSFGRLAAVVTVSGRGGEGQGGGTGIMGFYAIPPGPTQKLLLRTQTCLRWVGKRNISTPETTCPSSSPTSSYKPPANSGVVGI